MLAQRVWTMLAQTVFDIILTFQSRALRLSCQGYWTKLLPRRSRKARVAVRRWRGLGMFRMIPSSSDDFMGFWVYGQDSNDFHRPSKLHMLAPCGVASFRQFCWCGWIFFSKVSLCLLSGARTLAPLGRHGAKTSAASARRFLGSEWQLVRWAPSHLQRLPMDDGWQFLKEYVQSSSIIHVCTVRSMYFKEHDGWIADVCTVRSFLLLSMANSLLLTPQHGHQVGAGWRIHCAWQLQCARVKQTYTIFFCNDDLNCQRYT